MGEPANKVKATVSWNIHGKIQIDNRQYRIWDPLIKQVNWRYEAETCSGQEESVLLRRQCKGAGICTRYVEINLIRLRIGHSAAKIPRFIPQWLFHVSELDGMAHKKMWENIDQINFYFQDLNKSILQIDRDQKVQRRIERFCFKKTCFTKSYLLIGPPARINSHQTFL